MRATLFCAQPYAFGILKPLHDELQSKGHDVVWYLPNKHLNVFPYTNEVAHYTTIEEIHSFNSDAIFVPGNEVPHYLRGVKVQIFHGLAGEKKGHFRIRNYFDLYLTQGPYFTRRFNELAKKYKDFEVAETGWCKLDTLFLTKELFLNEKNQFLEDCDKQKIVLYAPTFSPSLTSAKALSRSISNLAKKHSIHLMVKFHDLMDKGIVSEYESIANNIDNIEVVSNPNILKYLVMADVMISDTSSAVYEFSFLNKPVITLNSSSPNIAWLNINNPNQLEDAFIDAISHDSMATKRQNLISQYHPYNDGKSSSRMIQSVEDYISRNGVPEKRRLNLYRRYKIRKFFGPKPGV